VVSTSYSDRTVAPGVHYRYSVSAYDQTGNESAQSAPVEAALP
jgi:fibronectin type 3 domain-containing protein